MNRILYLLAAALALVLAVRAADFFRIDLARTTRLLASDSEGARAAATEVLHRSDPVDVVQVLGRHLVDVEHTPWPQQAAMARIAADAVRRSSPDRVDPGGALRRAIPPLVPRVEKVSPAAAAAYLGLVACLGEPLSAAEVERRFPIPGAGEHARVETAFALGATRDAAAIPILDRRLTAAPSILRRLATQTFGPDQQAAVADYDALAWLAHYGHADAVRKVLRELPEKEPALTRYAVLEEARGRALLSAGDPDGFDVMVNALAIADLPSQRRRVVRALERITGACCGESVPAWRAWGTRHRQELARSAPIQGTVRCLRPSTGVLSAMVGLLLCMVVIAFMDHVHRFWSPVNGVFLTVIIHLFLWELVKNAVELGSLPYNSYRDRPVTFVLDAVVLPFAAILLVVLPTFRILAQRRRRRRSPG